MVRNQQVMYFEGVVDTMIYNGCKPLSGTQVGSRVANVKQSAKTANKQEPFYNVSHPANVSPYVVHKKTVGQWFEVL